MNQHTTDRLFDQADTLVALARARRVDAINRNPRLSWVVVVDADGIGNATLVFDTAPDFEQVVSEARAHGVLGQVRVRSITTQATKPRPLLLLPWHRVRARQRLGIAAE
jgi:hypothetical protein